MRLRRAAALVVLALVAVGCTAGPGNGGRLEGTHWVLSAYDDGGTLTVVPSDQYADARFTSGRINGFSGCDDYSALYQAGARSLYVSQLVSTREACAEDAMAFEATFQQAFVDSRYYGTRQDTLTIYGADGATLLVFDPAPRNPLLGSWVVDSFAGDGGDVTPLADTTLTAVFGLTSVGGSAGCNSYDGTYGTNGRVVTIGRLATTQAACPDEVMSQETAFLAAMQGAAFVDRRGTSLFLTDRNDAVLVAMSRPEPEATASPVPSPTATPEPSTSPTPAPTATAKPTATATPKPPASPTPTPSASATPKPTPTATYAPTPTPTAAPTLEPPASLPPVAECGIPGPSGTVLATITYPKAWFTVAEPAEIACRYFDPAEIVVPADPATVTAAVSIVGAGVPYADAVTAATDPAAWEVLDQGNVTVSGLPATFVEATSTSDATGVPVGTTRYAYIIDYSVLAAVVIQTQGPVGDATYDANTSVVDLIAAESTIVPAS